MNAHSTGKSKPHQCTSCNKVFSTAKEERRHALTHITERERGTTSSSFEEAPAVEDVYEHERPLESLPIIDKKKITFRPYQCQFCEKRFHKKKQCKAHESIHRKSEKGSRLPNHVINRDSGSQVFNKPKRKKNNSSNIEVDVDKTVRYVTNIQL